MPDLSPGQRRFVAEIDPEQDIKVGTGYYLTNSWAGLGFRLINRDDLGMGMGADNKSGMKGAGRMYVIGVTGSAMDLVRTILAGVRRSYAIRFIHRYQFASHFL